MKTNISSRQIRLTSIFAGIGLIVAASFLAAQSTFAQDNSDKAQVKDRSDKRPLVRLFQRNHRSKHQACPTTQRPSTPGPTTPGPTTPGPTTRSMPAREPGYNQEEVMAAIECLDMLADGEFRLVRAIGSGVLSSLIPKKLESPLADKIKALRNKAKQKEKVADSPPEPSAGSETAKQAKHLKVMKLLGSDPRLQDWLEDGYLRDIDRIMIMDSEYQFRTQNGLPV